jgi:pimeloyl-ACP methyl ester carboxylesterase
MPQVAANDGATIAFEVAGEGPPLMLVHGITESRASWAPLLDGLCRDHRVITVDLRGHGTSERRAPFDAITMAEDLHAVVADTGATAPLVVGHSLGGAVVSLYAANHPVRGAVNIDQPLALGGFKALLEPIEPLLRGDEATFAATMQSVFATFYGPLPDAERARLEAIAHPEQEVVLGVWDLVLTSAAEELDTLIATTAAMIDAPYLALHGSDPGDEYRAWLHAAVPQATFEVWPDHGHYPHLVDPARFLERIRSFESAG